MLVSNLSAVGAVLWQSKQEFQMKAISPKWVPSQFYSISSFCCYFPKLSFTLKIRKHTWKVQIYVMDALHRWKGTPKGDWGSKIRESSHKGRFSKEPNMGDETPSGLCSSEHWYMPTHKIFVSLTFSWTFSSRRSFLFFTLTQITPCVLNYSDCRLRLFHWKKIPYFSRWNENDGHNPPMELQNPNSPCDQAGWGQSVVTQGPRQGLVVKGFCHNSEVMSNNINHTVKTDFVGEKSWAGTYIEFIQQARDVQPLENVEGGFCDF